MLRLKDIRKEYKTFDFTQTALDGVSVSFRDNEFAAILGPSGSGKTTMLNIIGGLDHYDDGDLEIDEISTKKYKASDWDTYRNNRIGFVFQSYNLISHQSVLANVELALTLGGVSKKERKERAEKALEEVGLGEHARKLPSQLSGGQMQRVALARALINDPEILLADEPTGALDTKTSEQVMDLLKEIAKDRLVIMVTHNPELADEYANRIIKLQDGQIVSDTNEFDPDKEERRKARPPRRVSMSFLTAISLSLSNLMTKKGRTFVTALAGSIGIVGIAAILALSNGINAYIADIEEETMSIYPLTVQSTGIDLTSLISNMTPGDSAEKSEEDEEQERKREEQGIVKERKVVESLFESQNENDLKALKAYIVENEEQIEPYVKNIQYTYDVTPQIYLADTSKGISQVSPDALLRSYGIGGQMGVMSMLGGGGMMNMFHEMPGDISMFDYQYEVMAGRWPSNYDESVLVLLPNGSVSDFLLYSTGIRDRDELKSMLEVFIKDSEADVKLDNQEMEITYDKLLSAKMKIVSAANRYEYDEEFKVWIDKSSDDKFMEDLIEQAMDLKVVGVIRPNPDVTATSLSPGINYTPELISHLMEAAAKEPIVKEQLEKPTINVITGKTFAAEREDNNSDFDFKDLLEVDEEAIQKAFKFDESKISLDMSGLQDSISLDMSGLGDGFSIDMASLGDGLSLDMSGLGDSLSMDMSGLENIETPKFDMDELTKLIAAQVSIPEDALTIIMQNVIQDFLMEIVSQGAMPPQDVIAAFSAYLARPDVQANINGQLAALMEDSQMSAEVEQVVQEYMNGIMQGFMANLMKQMEAMQSQLQSQLQTQLQTQLQNQIQGQMENVMTELTAQIQNQIQNQMQVVMGEIPKQIQAEIEKEMEKLPEQMKEAMSVDEEAMASAFKVKMSEKEVMELMNALMNQTESTADSNLTLFGYANSNAPSQISFFPTNFEGKERVGEFLENYNRQMEANGDDHKVITYTDLVGVMMSSVTDIVDTISYALIAFVAISLIVSSIMIGVITYISVLERKKEIGILRALGASKGDVRTVFNAETLIIGFIAGTLGITITQVISVIANIIVYDKLKIKNIAQLPWESALILIGISMILAFVSGFFPSTAAARKDPVEALRSE